MKLSFGNTVTAILLLLVALSGGVMGLTFHLQVKAYRNQTLSSLRTQAQTTANLVDPTYFARNDDGDLSDFYTYCQSLSLALEPVLADLSVMFYQVENGHVVGAGTDNSPGHVALWQTASAGNVAEGIAMSGTNKVYMSTAPVFGPGNSKVIGIVELQKPYRFLGDDAITELAPAFAVGITMLVMVGACAFMFQAGLLRSLRTLAEATQIFGLGNLDHRVRVQGTGEIGRLCKGFNQMARQLKNSRESLMSRTQDLEESNAKLEVQIRERRKAEELLRESQESYQTMAETASDGLVTVDKDLNIQFVNPAMSSILGLSEEDMLKSVLTDLLEDESGNSLPPSAPYNQPLRVLGIHLDGHRVPIEVSWGLAKSEGVEHYIGIIRDIEDRIRYEEELKQAKELAEAATEAKSDFLANMSHEIRTPMNAVIGMAAMLLDTELNKQQREYAYTIHNSGESLLTLINNILDFSKLESGKMELDPVEFNLVELIEETLDMLGTKARENELLLAYECRPGTPVHLIGDSNRLRQILINTINNALKFTHKGHVLLSVKAEEIDDDEYEILFSVEDTGIGISAAKLPKLFQSFHQVDASTTRKYGGTGLGLAICKSFCELMGGKIWAESKEGEGSKFNFTVKAQQLPKSPVCFLHSYHPELANKTVMINCQSPILRRIVSDYTSWWGMKATAFETPEQFDDALRDQHVDFVFAEAGAEDRETIKFLQSLGREKDFHTIILTDLGAPLEDGDKLSITHKPLKAVELFQIISGEVSEDMDATNIQMQATSTFRLGDVMPMDILVAEDNVVNQKVATEFLNRLGYGIDVVNNGLEAIEAIDTSTYDVVFMDVHMPQMDGLEASQKINEDVPADKRPYIIAMTASAMPGDRDMCLKAGMQDYISKPVKLQAVRKALESAWKVVCENVPHKEMRKKPKDNVTQPTPDRISSGPVKDFDSGRIDYETLNFFRNGDDPHGAEVVEDLITLYLDTFKVNYSRLTDALNGNDREKARKVAHTIKGSSSNLGIKSITDMCKVIETVLKVENIAADDVRISELSTEAEEAEKELLAYMESIRMEQ